MRSREEIINSLKGGLIVSCQALRDEPLYGSLIMAREAVAAKEGGAVGIRCNTPEDTLAIKQAADLPVIALYKKNYYDSDVYITPTLKEVEELSAVNPEIIAVDATDRIRPGKISLIDFFRTVKQKYPEQIFMADCATFEEGINAAKMGFDMVSTTLCGYTAYTKGVQLPATELMDRLADELDIPVIAEGGIWEADDLKGIFKRGKVYAAVIGSAITRPQLITKHFSDAVKEGVLLRKTGGCEGE